MYYFTVIASAGLFKSFSVAPAKIKNPGRPGKVIYNEPICGFKFIAASHHTVAKNVYLHPDHKRLERQPKSKMMTAKEQLIKKIQSCQDSELLAIMNDWMNQLNCKKNVVEPFSEKEIHHVNLGYSDYKKGRVYSQQEAATKFNEWLKGKK